MYCEQCGKRIAETVKFCPYCGNAVGIVDNAQSQQSVKREISTPPSLETKQGSIPASHEAKQEQKYVGFWARFAANFLDGILINILCIPAWIYLIYRAQDSSFDSYDVNGAILLYSALYSLHRLYFLFFGSRNMPRLVKWLFRPRLLMKKQLIGRYFAYVLSTLPLGLGFLWIAFDPKKQGWHDKLAGTAVIYVGDN